LRSDESLFNKHYSGQRKAAEEETLKNTWKRSAKSNVETLPGRRPV